MFGLRKRLWILGMLACLVGAQVHVSAEFDPCLWKPASAGQTHRTPLQHTTSGHGCQGCFAGGWAVVSALPGLAFTLLALRLDIDPPRLLSKNRLAEVSSPRAPPHA